MKQQDNLNTFFQKRLLEQEPTAADWNTPSDDLWNKAKPHFPKKKKKRRVAWIWWGAAIIGLLALGAIIITMVQADNSIATTVPTENNASIANQTDTELPTEKTGINTNLDNTQRNAGINEQTNSLDKNLINTDPTAKNTSNKGNLAKPITSSKKSVNTYYTPLSDSSTNIPSFEGNQALATDATTDQNYLDSKNSLIKSNSKASKPETIADIMIQKINKLPITLSTKYRDKISLYHLGLATSKIIKPLRKKSFRRWEIGVSHSRFIKSPQEELENEIEDVENYNVSTTYKNINLPITYRFSPRYSISSGLAYSSLNTDLQLREVIELQTSSPQENLRSLISESANFGSLQINEQDSSFIEVTFNPGVSLETGDTITIDAVIPIRQSLIEFPIRFNSHRQYGRWEFISQMGLSIDYFIASIPDLDLDVYRKGELISRQLSFSPLSDKYFGLSFNLGIGTRYLITDHWNIGLSAKWDIYDTSFSRYDIGTYVRF